MTKEQKILFKVAKAYLTPPGLRTEFQDKVTCLGLCNACGWYNWPACDFFYKLKPIGSHWFWIPTHNPKSDQIRGLFALLLATMPEKDFMEFMEV